MGQKSASSQKSELSTTEGTASLSPPEIKRSSRRRFLKTLLVGVPSLVCYAAAQRVLRLAIIGVGDRGRKLGETILSMRPYYHYGKLVALCDVDSRRSTAFKTDWHLDADLYEDYHRVIERDDVEAVIIATPDHWHAAIAVDAMRAGKAVYCEKPLALTVAEGRMLVETARQTGVVFQVGTVQRSDARFRTACDLVQNDRLGEIRKVTVNVSRVPTGGPFATAPVPPGLNWDRWLGQAPYVPYCPERCHYNFRWWWEYSGGILTDWGVHHLDIVHCALGLEHSGPQSVSSQAELPRIPNGYNVARNFKVELRYPGGITVEVKSDPERNGIQFEGTRGRIFVNRQRITGKPYEDLNTNPIPAAAPRLTSPGGWFRSSTFLHLREFFDCVQTGRQPISDILSHHYSLTACHVANISMRLGRTLAWDTTHETFPGDVEACALLSRTQRSPYEPAVTPLTLSRLGTETGGTPR